MLADYFGVYQCQIDKFLKTDEAKAAALRCKPSKAKEYEQELRDKVAAQIEEFSEKDIAELENELTIMEIVPYGTLLDEVKRCKTKQNP